MANATPRDARAGFAIYLERDGDIPLKAINARLEKAGYGRIAQRTLTHYRNLVNAGFNRYISINRFDVARSSQAYENMSSLGRYRYRQTQHEVSIIFLKASRLVQATGTVIEVSDVGAVIEFTDRETIQNLRDFKPVPRDTVILHYPTAGDTIKGSVIEGDPKSTPPVIEIEYASLTSVATIEDARPLPSAAIQFRLVPEDDSTITLDILGRRLHCFFDLIEAVRALHNEAGQHSEEHLYASPPLVTHMQLSSPAVLLLQLAPEVVELLSWSLLGGLLSVGLRKQWHQGSVHKSQAELLDVETQLKDVELRRKSLEQRLRADIVANVRRQLPSSTLTNEQLERIVIAYVMPSLRALSQTNLHAIDVDIAENGSNGESTTHLDGPEGEGT